MEDWKEKILGKRILLTFHSKVRNLPREKALYESFKYTWGMTQRKCIQTLLYFSAATNWILKLFADPPRGCSSSADTKGWAPQQEHHKTFLSPPVET